MAVATNLGFPRIGARRQLKQATEAYWEGRLTEEELLRTGAELRRQNWLLQREAGIQLIPCNDFSFYDHVLDTACMVGAIPARYGWQGGPVTLSVVFAMARGTPGDGVPALEMTKWFDTNYHYIVPELAPDQEFTLAWPKPVEELREARALGIRARPVLLGPVSFLLLSKPAPGHAFPPLRLLDRLLPVYAQVLALLRAEGAEWVQVDEPCLVLDLDEEAREAYRRTYAYLAGAAPGLRLLLATYFGGLGEHLPLALRLPVHGLHLDLCRAPQQLEEALRLGVPEGMVLSLGVVDGRNVWRTDLETALCLLERARDALGSERVMVAPSCSLLHVPLDVELERRLDPEIRSWLAFARQKLEEVAVLARALREGREAVAEALAESARIAEARRRSPRRTHPAVQARLAEWQGRDPRRPTPVARRREIQRRILGLPPFPTTTIGSFPQTPELRRLRARLRRGEISREEYEEGIRQEIARVIRLQEEIGLDVLVHGEPERSDMVEYFAEQLQGFALTEHGWVQSYGTRYVKPPIIYGDVWRPQPMTVRWITYAQSLTSKPVKGMLTGPVTMMQWSFVRDDQPREVTCRQIALALRDEVLDLEAAGIRVIQIDEPALREAAPLRRAEWPEYFRWATECFRLVTSGVKDETQIHTHMCYSEFNDILPYIAEMDADVLLIEAARSRMELLDAFARFRYPGDVGPGVYDIHSPRVPPVEEILELLRKAASVLDPGQLWVNPDCGLKTRRYEEAVPALRHMVAAARAMAAGAPAPA